MNSSGFPASSDLGSMKSKGNSDLMSRLQSFLPKMANANKELEHKIECGDNTEGRNTLQIDSALRKDENIVDDSGHPVECLENVDNENITSNGEQTIEMTVALGNLESNPIMSLLTNDDESESNKLDGVDVNIDDKNELRGEDLPGKRKERDEANKSGIDVEEPLFTVRSIRRKKPLS